MSTKQIGGYSLATSVIGGYSAQTLDADLDNNLNPFSVNQAGNTHGNRKLELPLACQLSSLTLICSAKSVTADSIFTLELDAGDTAVTVTVTGAGTFTDISNTVTVAAGDGVSYHQELGTGGTTDTIRQYSFIYQPI